MKNGGIGMWFVFLKNPFQKEVCLRFSCLKDLKSQLRFWQNLNPLLLMDVFVFPDRLNLYDKESFLSDNTFKNWDDYFIWIDNDDVENDTQTNDDKKKIESFYFFSTKSFLEHSLNVFSKDKQIENFIFHSSDRLIPSFILFDFYDENGWLVHLENLHA